MSWFGRNWPDVFTTAFDLVTTMYMNYSKNFIEVTKRVLSWVTENFKATFTAVVVILSNLATNVAVFNAEAVRKGDMDLKSLWTGLFDGLDVQFKALDLDGAIKPLTDGFKSGITEAWSCRRE